MRLGIIVASMALAFTACGNAPHTGGMSTETKATKPAVDLSTPDRAIKSYWAMVDATNAAEYEIILESRSRHRDVRARLNSLFSADVRNSLEPEYMREEIFSRDIVSVDVETESRAVIVATIRNATPIPANAEVSKSDEEQRRDGDRYKYVLEREGEDWLVAEIWEYASYLRDWRKVVPRDTTPSVPQFTYNGF